MDDERLDQLLRVAAEEWRVAPKPEHDALWDRIEAEAFQPMPRRWNPGWGLVGAAAAASLVFGVFLGRLSQPNAVPVAMVAPGDPAAAGTPADGSPYQRSAEELLGRTAILLAALPDASLPAGPSYEIARQGGELLVTTRVLLDSPLGVDPQMRNLLEDLELVLAQVAHLQAPGSRDLGLIHDAIDRRDIVPRLRSAVLGTVSFDNIELN